ncbi:methyltransferase-like protein 9 isoform X2 [Gigantopelta aegis]|uniref:methyltransferase-like protein 9 isoform X2 n=1 Tax=Gigantopelta aegis TaxID=1735272 RepID=UPI001B887DA1|nr:methyltransferase-like protein 9 isoform X2 [Gigantopelta aegis]
MFDFRSCCRSKSLVFACFVACVSVLSVMSQYHIRSPLLRSMYHRMLDDERHRADDHVYWYHIDSSRLPADMCEKFIPLNQDAETSEFLNDCYEKADWVFTQIRDAVLKYMFSWFLTSTSINGWLRRGSMFIFSREQLQLLLNVSAHWRAENMLDLGAGDGMVTSKMAHYFNNVFVTEISSVMTTRLQEKGYMLLDVDSWSESSHVFDLIGCLNLLDRCNQPIAMLHSIKKSLRPGSGRLIVAVVLPFKPYVEVVIWHRTYG